MRISFSIQSLLMASVFYGGALCLSTPVQAGFDFIAPPVMTQSAPSAPVMPPPTIDMMPLPGEQAAPVTAQVLPVNRDVNVVPSAPPVMIQPAPVVAVPVPVQQPVMVTPVVTSTPATQIVPEAMEQRDFDYKRSVYPPKGNGAAAPLKGNQVAVDHYHAPSRKVMTESVVAPAPVVAAPAPVQQQTTPIVVDVQPSPAVAAPVVKPVATPAVVPETTVQTTVPSTPSAPAMISGFGSNLPLSLAMEQIVPADYQVQYQDQPNPDTIVSWLGGRTWDKALEDMLYVHGYRVRVDQKTVTIFKAGNPPGAVQAASATPTPAAVKGDVPASDLGVAVPAPTMDQPDVANNYQAQKVDIFSAAAGENVQTVLNRWSKQAGVQLYYQANNALVLKAPASYNSTFARAIEQMLVQFKGQADRPVATLYPNAPTGPVVLQVKASVEKLAVK